MNRLNSFYTQNDFHEVVLEFELGKTALEGARSHKISKNDTKLMISPLSRRLQGTNWYLGVNWKPQSPI